MLRQQCQLMEHTISGVGVLDKSMAVLEVVASADGPVRLGDLVAATGLSKATAHRLATALAAHGLVRRDGDGAYRLGLRLVGLGHAAAEDWPLGTLARPVLEALRDGTGESVQLYVRDGDQRTCVVSLESPHELRTIVPEGIRLPLGVGSAGRILSGAAPADRWAASVEERARGVASVSAAVVRDGDVIAAVGISGPLERLGTTPGERFGDAVAGAAAQIATLRSA
jgi:DNA-binding IclR family transcriptional regulator